VSLPPSPPAWVTPWVGRPFEERGRGPEAFDCWGLVRAVLQERLGASLPALDDRYSQASDREDLAALVVAERGPWRPVEEAALQEGDCVLFRVQGYPSHVGVVVALGWMLHSRPATGSVLERWDGPRWRPRLCGFFRHG